MTTQQKRLASELAIATVPVFVDDAKRTNRFPMTRCIYFAFANTDVAPNWNLNAVIPFLLLTLEGVVIRPINHEHFVSPTDFDILFDEIEKVADLEVHNGDIWVPNSLFDVTKSTVERGAVYRLSFDLFRLCYRFRSYSVAQDEFIRQCITLGDSDSPALINSPDETEALRLWNKEQIRQSQTNYQDQFSAKEILPKKRRLTP